VSWEQLDDLRCLIHDVRNNGGEEEVQEWTDMTEEMTNRVLLELRALVATLMPEYVRLSTICKVFDLFGERPQTAQ